MYCHQITSPSTIYHVGNASDMHSIIQSGLIPGGKSVKRDRHSVFFTAVNPIDIQDPGEVQYDLDKPRIVVYEEKLNTIWTNLESHRTNTLGELITVQYIGAIQSLLRERDCDSIKLDRMQLLFQTHYHRFVKRKWYAWKLVKNLTAGYTKSPRLPRVTFMPNS